jgi:hypothetical protein
MAFDPSGTQPPQPINVAANLTLQGAPQAPFGNPILDTRPGPPKLLNSASGGVNTRFTTDIFSGTDNNGNPIPPPPNPFIGSPVQTNRLQAFCIVIVGGVDITDKLNPYLISVRVVDTKIPTAEIEIDDRDARLPIPPLRAPISVNLGWIAEGSYMNFEGEVVDIEYSDARGGGGRHMTVHCRASNNVANKAKEPGSDNLGDGAPPGENVGKLIGLDKWLGHATGTAGFTVDWGADALAKAGKLLKDHHDRNNEGLYQLVEREAKGAGLTTQWLTGNKVKLLSLNDKQGSVIAQVGYNLISLRVRPYSASGSWSDSRQHWFDTKLGQWKRMKSPITTGVSQFDAAIGAIAGFLLPKPAPDEASAQADRDGGSEQVGYGQGHGRICINGEPSAKFMCAVTVIGVRSGVDGSYTAWDAVEHIYSRQGYVTWLDVITDAKGATGSNVLEGFITPAQIGAQLAAAYAKQPGGGVVQADISPSPTQQAQQVPAGEPIDSGTAASILPNFSTPPVPNVPIPLDPLGGLGSQPVGGSL